MSQEEYQQFEELGLQVLNTLKAALASGDPGDELGQKPPNCTPNGSVGVGVNTAERPMPAWPECMWMTPGLPPIMMSRCKPVQLDF